MFNCPYSTANFPQYAESIPGPSTDALASAAKTHGVHIIGGSIPERDPHSNKYYNTATVFSPSGHRVARYRKMHLFDIDVPGKITFKESDILSGGDGFTTFEMDQCKVGLGVCYDVRFPELAQILTRRGCDLLVYPGAFNMTTGPLHWELLIRARALDNMVFVAMVSPARDEDGPYQAWGHSTVANPWGEVIAKIDAGHEAILYADLGLQQVQQIRQQIPVPTQKRFDLYRPAEVKDT